MLGGPVQHGRPVRGGQHRAGGPLVRGRQDHGVGAGFGQDVSPDAVVVDGHPDDLEPGCPGGGQGVVA